MPLLVLLLMRLGTELACSTATCWIGVTGMPVGVCNQWEYIKGGGGGGGGQIIGLLVLMIDQERRSRTLLILAVAWSALGEYGDLWDFMSYANVLSCVPEYSNDYS
jgi:hypothetical protein